MKYIRYILAVLLIVGLTACSDWLDVKPKDKVLEKDQYNTEGGIQSVLNGIYMNMATAPMYGQYMSTRVGDALAGYYNPGLAIPNSYGVSIASIMDGNYRATEVEDKLLAPMWKRSYETILHINVFIDVMSENDVLTEDKKNILLGETHALRAYIHFDMFRFFGPIYEGNEAMTSLPYNKASVVVVPEYLSASKFMEAVLEDLEKAEALLKDDPIITDGVLDTDPLADRTFYLFRNKRMNYYAVMGLKARVLQYIGEGQLAADAAQSVIDATIAQKKTFIWTPLRSTDDVVINDSYKILSIASGDLIAYHDVMFGLNNQDIYTTWTNFTNDDNDSQIYGVTLLNLNKYIFKVGDATFESFDDYRTRQWTPSLADPSTYVTRRYSRTLLSSSNAAHPLREFMPLMRISEMYYIVAENAMNQGDGVKAVEMFNTVVRARGWADVMLLSSTGMTKDIFDEELRAEYYREFYGEGQVFFYHKRRNESQILDGKSSGFKEISSDKYSLPIPKIEIEINE